MIKFEIRVLQKLHDSLYLLYQYTVQRNILEEKILAELVDLPALAKMLPSKILLIFLIKWRCLNLPSL